MIVRILVAVTAGVFVVALVGWTPVTEGDGPPDADTRGAGPPTPQKCWAAPAVAIEIDLLLDLPAEINRTKPEQITFRLFNKGKGPVTLVMPGDGSDAGWRTPVVGWSFLPVGSKKSHPTHSKNGVLGRCGNINTLEPHEIFVLRPGDGKDLKQWVGFSQLPPAGTYRVVFYYSNLPRMKWSGLPSIEGHDPAAMVRLQESTPVSLVSNEVVVEISD